MQKIKLPCTKCNRIPEDGMLFRISTDGKLEISKSGGLCTGCANLILALPRCPQCGGGIGEILRSPAGEFEKKICHDCRAEWWTAVVSGFSPDALLKIDIRALDCLQKNPDVLRQIAIKLLADGKIKSDDLLD